MVDTEATASTVNTETWTPVRQQSDGARNSLHSRPKIACIPHFPTEDVYSPTIEPETAVATFSLNLLRRHGKRYKNLTFKQAAVLCCYWDYWGLVSSDGYLLRDTVGDLLNFEPLTTSLIEPTNNTESERYSNWND